ncbi:conserved hypothetical protein [Candidatus Sulfopaludibacter sp. SbA4]|nr:conserved hypothetical protein [Candidatus Sulfopaludibacter sp. SbA4]
MPKVSTRDKAAATKNRPQAATKGPGLSLLGEDGKPCKIRKTPTLGMARSWAYVLRNRNRWARSKSARDDLTQRARADLEVLGVTQAMLHSLSGNSVLEIQIPYTSEEEGWAERIFPWEFVLQAAFRLPSKTVPMLVVRHLKCVGAAPSAPASNADPKLLIVESMPGWLTGLYTFESLINEEKLVASSLGVAPVVLRNPTLARVAEEVKSHKPSIVHYAGIDNHQASAFLNKAQPTPETVIDGLMFSDLFGSPVAASAMEVAGAVNRAKDAPPMLVTFNCYNTAKRIAALAVAEGAAAAIGFHDQVVDEVAELLLAQFYRALKLSNGWSVFEALKSVVTSVEQERDLLTGTGIVLWSRTSLIKASKDTEARASVLRESVRLESMKPLGPETDLADALKAEVKPNEKLNYSLLHNNRNVFKTFKIVKVPVGVVRGVQVQVFLQAGGEIFPYELSQDLKEPVWDLNPLVRIGLTSQLSRTISESIKTTLSVKVTCGGCTIYHQTHRVTLLPLDQWQDDETGRGWLPSFVMPRDPAVPRIVDAAQRYLVALTDRMDAGFVGYQPVKDWPPGDGDLLSPVDTQVRALWWAMLSELPLSYINPPPTFSAKAQRVRTPSEIIAGRRGTCIDLALMMAACLEYVDIYPVLFLFSGHAYPGYCVSEDAHNRLAQLFYAPLEGDKETGDMATEQRYRAWMLGAEAYSKLFGISGCRRLDSAGDGGHDQARRVRVGSGPGAEAV